MKSSAVKDYYNKLKIREALPRLYWTFSEYDAEGGLAFAIDLHAEEDFYSLGKLVDFVNTIPQESYAEISFFKAKNYGALLDTIIVDGATGAISSGETEAHSTLGRDTEISKPVGLDPQDLRKGELRDEVVSSVSYQKFAQIFQEDLRRREQEKRLLDLEKENSFLRQQLKDQSDLMDQLRKTEKQASFMQALSGIGGAVLRGLLAKNATKIGATVQSLAGIPAEAVSNFLAEGEDTQEPEQSVNYAQNAQNTQNFSEAVVVGNDANSAVANGERLAGAFANKICLAEQAEARVASEGVNSQSQTGFFSPADLNLSTSENAPAIKKRGRPRKNITN